MKNRHRYRPLQIDMAPFVSVALMLIVFFVWLKTAKQKQVFCINAPGGILCYPERIMANAILYLLDDNRIGCLFYKPDSSSAEFLETDYSTQGLRCVLANRLTAPHSIVIITPSAESTFRNLVDMLDEIRIHGKIDYLLNEYFMPKDKRLINEYEEYKKRAPVSRTAFFD